ncbi:serine/threonine protein kinase [Saccharophagus degradans]|uniref:serine/threonine-protein kinase n=1 Tax=Saccharophagus degradans TaxID=86304 RepID=UPI001C0A1211|nr:serine/threonine-protein kinase [Saccharophagus degradans]MBU2984414.1 serine/threonine protein kinase [Saccharophagus degradans]
MTALKQRWAKAIWRAVLAFSTRGMVVVVVLGFCLLPRSYTRFAPLDLLTAKLASYLVEAPQTLRGVTVIEVPERSMQLWASDIHRAGPLSSLLSNVLHGQAGFVTLVLPQPIDFPTGPASELLQELAVDNPQAQTLVDRQAYLASLLADKRLVIGVSSPRQPWLPAGAKPIPIVASDTPIWQHETLQRWLWGSPQNYGAALDSRPSVEHFPVYAAHNGIYRLAYQQDSEQVYPHLLLHQLKEKQAQVWSDSKGFPYRWQPSDGFVVGNHTIHASASAGIVPLWGLTERMTPYIERLSLEEGLARGAFPEQVYIVSDADSTAIPLILSAASLSKGDYLWQPLWVAPSLKLFMLLALCYLIFVMPRLRVATGVWITSALIIFAFVSATVLGAVRHIWVPATTVSLLLAFGHLGVLIWWDKRTKWQALAEQAEKASVLQASIHLANGALDDAYDVLQNCKASGEAFSYLYELSGLYASKRNYERAIATLDSLIERAPNYKDAKQKRSAIASVHRSQQNQLEKTTLMIDATVAIDAHKVDRPVLGRYEIRSALGKGAMGQVYLGFDPRIARQVAIKTLNYNQFDAAALPDIKQRFFREAEAAGRLNHPNIVAVYDLGEEPDLAFIAMDYVDGSPLSAFVNADNLLPVFEVYRVIHDVAVALEYAHQHQIVHRDIKPGNIMYRPVPYHLKVADFGIARLTDNSQTTTGEILGSPLYMAPEQLKGKKVDYAADLFSLGVTFYQLLSGELPFKGDNLASLTYEIIHGKHKSVRQVRKDLPTSAARITNQALQKDASDRYSSAADMAAALNKAIKRDFSQEAKKAGFV